MTGLMTTGTVVDIERLRRDIVDAASERDAMPFARIIAGASLQLDETVGSGILWVMPDREVHIPGDKRTETEREMNKILWALGFRYAIQLTGAMAWLE